MFALLLLRGAIVVLLSRLLAVGAEEAYVGGPGGGPFSDLLALRGSCSRVFATTENAATATSIPVAKSMYERFMYINMHIHT